jgi:putative PIN family toxin of toxin-antitoxin system
MRVVIDTNILISALLSKESPAAQLLEGWRHGRFSVLTAKAQIEELARVLRYPKIRDRVPATEANWLIADMHELTVFLEALPVVQRSRDPDDNYLLALSEAGGADYLVTRDKRDVLSLKEHGATKIVSLRGFLSVIES